MSKDFAPFLKYIPDATPDWLPPVGEGWHAIVYDLLSEIDKLVAEHIVLMFVVTQIKEKFGSLRVYYRVDQSVTDDVRQKISEIVNQHTARTSSICEVCSAPGRIGSYFTSYYQALCRSHAMSRTRADVPTMRKFNTWEIRLVGDHFEMTDHHGSLLNRLDIERLELRLMDKPESHNELNALRDARYLASI